MMASFDKLANQLFGGKRAETNSVLHDGETHTLIGTATGNSADGSVMVELSSDVTNPEPIEIDGETYYSDADTSVELPTTASVQEGDEVLVSVYGGTPLRSPVVTGVVGSGDRVAGMAQDAYDLADSVEGIAQQALDVANATGQHFWSDEGGIHVTEVTQDEWDESNSGANVLINSIGQLFRDGLNNLLALVTGTTTGVAIYDGGGNASTNIVASFSADGTTIGRDGARRIVLTDGSMLGVDDAGVQFLDISQTGAQDTYTINKTMRTYTSEEVPISGRTLIASADAVISADAGSTIAFDDDLTLKIRFFGKTVSSVLPGSFFKATHTDSSATFVLRARSFIQGTAWSNTASGTVGFSDGTSATVENVFVYDPVAATLSWSIYVDGESFNAREQKNSVSVSYPATSYTPSYEFGDGEATGSYSVAIGKATKASQDNQLAMGAWNVEDVSGDYALIIGNGTADNARSNAFTVDWSGNIWAAGKAALTGAIEAASAAITGAITAASATISGAISAASATISGALSAASATITGALSFGGSLTVGSETFTTEQVTDVLTKALPVELFSGTYSETVSSTVTLSETAANFSRLRIEWEAGDGYRGSTELSNPDGAKFMCSGIVSGSGTNPTTYVTWKIYVVSGTRISNWQRSGGYQRGQINVYNSGYPTTNRNELIGITRVLGWR